MAGFIYGLCHEKDISTCVEYGQKCAITSIKSDRNVSDEISQKTLE